VAVGRFFIGDGPVASLKARRITPDQATISQVLTVTYRDGDNFIDTDGLDNRDLRVTGPNGFVQYARFKGFATFNGIAVVATYKLPPPGGNWFFADAGEYVVQLVGRQVADVGGRFAAGRVLGRFVLALWRSIDELHVLRHRREHEPRGGVRDQPIPEAPAAQLQPGGNHQQREHEVPHAGGLRLK
jgi:hypothetical protein